MTLRSDFLRVLLREGEMPDSEQTQILKILPCYLANCCQFHIIAVISIFPFNKSKIKLIAKGVPRISIGVLIDHLLSAARKLGIPQSFLSEFTAVRRSSQHRRGNPILRHQASETLRMLTDSLVRMTGKEALRRLRGRAVPSPQGEEHFRV